MGIGSLNRHEYHHIFPRAYLESSGVEAKKIQVQVVTTHKKRSGPTCATNTKSTLDPQPSEERIRTMTKHGSASPRKQASRTLDANLKRRARKLATDSRVDPRTRSLIRYELEIKDRHLEQVVNRVEAGESIDHIGFDSD